MHATGRQLYALHSSHCLPGFPRGQGVETSPLVNPSLICLATEKQAAKDGPVGLCNLSPQHLECPSRLTDSLLMRMRPGVPHTGGQITQDAVRSRLQPRLGQDRGTPLLSPTALLLASGVTFSIERRIIRRSN